MLGCSNKTESYSEPTGLYVSEETIAQQIDETIAEREAITNVIDEATTFVYESSEKTTDVITNKDAETKQTESVNNKDISVQQTEAVTQKQTQATKETQIQTQTQTQKQTQAVQETQTSIQDEKQETVAESQVLEPWPAYGTVYEVLPVPHVSQAPKNYNGVDGWVVSDNTFKWTINDDHPDGYWYPSITWWGPSGKDELGVDWYGYVDLNGGFGPKFKGEYEGQTQRYHTYVWLDKEHSAKEEFVPWPTYGQVEKVNIVNGKTVSPVAPVNRIWGWVERQTYSFKWTVNKSGVGRWEHWYPSSTTSRWNQNYDVEEYARIAAAVCKPTEDGQYDGQIIQYALRIWLDKEHSS